MNDFLLALADILDNLEPTESLGTRGAKLLAAKLRYYLLELSFKDPMSINVCDECGVPCEEKEVFCADCDNGR